MERRENSGHDRRIVSLEFRLMSSFIQLALCDEIASWIKGFMKGFEVSEETLALDVIAEMGPDGQYLSTRHTKDHYRERWYPGLFERTDYGTWLKNGEKDLFLCDIDNGAGAMPGGGR